MVGRIGSDVSGRQALSVIDKAVARSRTALSDAVQASDDIERRRAELATRRAEALKQLAVIRLDMIETGEISTGEGIDKRVVDLLTRHDAFLRDLQEQIDAAAREISKKESERESAADARDSSVEAFERLVETVRIEIQSDPTYTTLKTAADQASSIAARAEQKLDLAREDRIHKGEPYEADPLFSYLWSRGFRTPRYRANPFVRFLDGWVARLCRYDKHWANYARLTELPDRLAEHVEKVEAIEADALQRLEDAEANALSAAGSEALTEAIAEARSRLDQVDAALNDAEERHRAAIGAHDAALAEEAGPVMEAKALLADALSKASFPELRVLASETVNEADDRMVDELVRLRSEELTLDVSARDISVLPDRRRHELARLEGFRRSFKASRYDSPYLVFSGAALGRVMDMILSDQIDGHDALRTLKRTARQLRDDDTERDWRFGGSQRHRSTGIPGIITEVLIEAAKQASRSKGIDLGGGPWGGSSPGRRSSLPRPRSSPRSGKRGGGFRTGGGF